MARWFLWISISRVVDAVPLLSFSIGDYHGEYSRYYCHWPIWLIVWKNNPNPLSISKSIYVYLYLVYIYTYICISISIHYILFYIQIHICIICTYIYIDSHNYVPRIPSVFDPLDCLWVTTFDASLTTSKPGSRSMTTLDEQHTSSWPSWGPTARLKSSLVLVISCVVAGQKGLWFSSCRVACENESKYGSVHYCPKSSQRNCGPLTARIFGGAASPKAKPGKPQGSPTTLAGEWFSSWGLIPGTAGFTFCDLVDTDSDTWIWNESDKIIE